MNIQETPIVEHRHSSVFLDDVIKEAKEFCEIITASRITRLTNIIVNGIISAQDGNYMEQDRLSDVNEICDETSVLLSSLFPVTDALLRLQENILYAPNNAVQPIKGSVEDRLINQIHSIIISYGYWGISDCFYNSLDILRGDREDIDKKECIKIKCSLAYLTQHLLEIIDTVRQMELMHSFYK